MALLRTEEDGVSCQIRRSRVSIFGDLKNAQYKTLLQNGVNKSQSMILILSAYRRCVLIRYDRGCDNLNPNPHGF